jgi:cell division protein FtsB
MKIFHVICLILFVSLQHSLFISSNSLFTYFDLKQTYNSYNNQITLLTRSNNRLNLEIEKINNSKSFLESYARENYGYIKEDEIFFQIIKDEK